MASPNTSYSELITTTLQERSGKIADNVSKSSAFLDRLNKRGNIRKFFTGGRTILQELEYAENGTFRRYSGYDLLDPSPSDVMTAAEFEIKQAAVAVSMSGLEMLQNQGDAAVIDLMASRIRNAERTLVNNIATDVFSDGTADGGRQIGGLQLLVADDPTTGTVGGINAATWTFWRNAVTDSGSTITSANVQGFMNAMGILTSRGNESTDLIVADDSAYTAYLASLQAIQQITTQGGTAGSGFKSLAFYGPGGQVDVVLERSAGAFENTGMPTGHMYFLNTNYIHFRPHADRNFTVDDAERVNTNQDAMVKYIFWAGNLTISNRAVQGLIKD
jgi:hypothetical protein